MAEDEPPLSVAWLVHAQAAALMVLAAATTHWSAHLRYALMTSNQQSSIPTSYAKLTATSLQLFSVLCECAALSELRLAVGVAINGAVIALCRFLSVVHGTKDTMGTAARWKSAGCVAIVLLGLLAVFLCIGESDDDDSKIVGSHGSTEARRPRFLASPALLYHIIASLLVMVFALSCITDTAVYTNYAARVLPIRPESAITTALFLTDANALVFAFVAGAARSNVLLFEKCLVELLRSQRGSPWLLLLCAAWMIMIMFESRWLGCGFLIDVGSDRPEWRVYRPYLWTWIALGVIHGALLFGDLPNLSHGPRQVVLCLAMLLLAAGVVLAGLEEASLMPRNLQLEDTPHPLADASESLLRRRPTSSSPHPSSSSEAGQRFADIGPPVSASMPTAPSPSSSSSSYMPPAFLSTI